jgi:hypothetical protein
MGKDILKGQTTEDKLHGQPKRQNFGYREKRSKGQNIRISLARDI